LQGARKIIKYLEDTLLTAEDINKSEAAEKYIEKRLRAIAVAKLVNASSKKNKIDIESQQREFERVKAEKKEIDERLSVSLQSNDFHVDMDESLLKEFRYSKTEGGISIQSFAGFDKTDEITIPESINGLPVIQIGFSAFENTRVKKVVLPPTIKRIGIDAFLRCRQLTNINLPDSIISLGERAFAETVSLKNIVLPANLQSVGKWCFRDSGITQITIPGSLKIIEQGCFLNCGALSDVYIQEGVESIKRNAFSGCRITRQHLPENIHVE